MAQKLNRKIELDRLLTYSVARAGSFSFALALAHADGVNRLISVILVTGKRELISTRAEGVYPHGS